MNNLGQTGLIAELNDCYRQQAGWEYSEDDLSAGDSADKKARRILSKVWQAVRSYQVFGPENAEHNFGIVEVEGVKVRWQINYLDRWSDDISTNPADPRVTRRTITITMELPE